MPTGVYKRTEAMYSTRRGRKPWNYRVKMSNPPWNKGRKGTYHTGYSYWKDKKFSIEHIEKIRRWHTENKIAWKGDLAGYHAMHKWVIAVKGKPKKCEKCGATDKKRYEWANIDHSYKRVESDYIRMCKSCHMKFDIKYNNYRVAFLESRNQL